MIILLQMLLSLARSIFEEQNNLDCLVSKIMTQARDLIKCERCVVFLLDLECEEAVSILCYYFIIYFWQRYISIYTFLSVACARVYTYSFFIFLLEPFGTLWSQARELFARKKSIHEKRNKTH